VRADPRGGRSGAGWSSEERVQVAGRPPADVHRAVRPAGEEPQDARTSKARRPYRR
jgi:hypothetical protein